MTEKTCETCKWRAGLYKPEDHDVTAGGATYKCIRRAPFVTGGMYSPTMTIWPWVRKDDSCGEHSPKEDERKSP